MTRKELEQLEQEAEERAEVYKRHGADSSYVQAKMLAQFYREQIEAGL